MVIRVTCLRSTEVPLTFPPLAFMNHRCKERFLAQVLDVVTLKDYPGIVYVGVVLILSSSTAD